MKGKDLQRWYGQLTAKERFQLTMEALAREDETEADRLSATCPRVTYTFTRNDRAYGNRLNASWQITTGVCLMLVQLSGKLLAVEASLKSSSLFLELVARESGRSYGMGWEAGCDHAWGTAGKRGPFPWKGKSSSEELIDEATNHISGEGETTNDDQAQLPLEDIKEALSVEVSIVVGAFARFCRTTMGVEPEVAVGAFCPQALGWLTTAWAAADDTRTDEALLMEHEAALTGAWRKLADMA